MAASSGAKPAVGAGSAPSASSALPPPRKYPPAPQDRHELQLQSRVLLTFAANLPVYEAGWLKNLVLERSGRVFTAAKAFLDTDDFEAYRTEVMLSVIETAVRRAQSRWESIFVSCPTELARAVSRQERSKMPDPADSSLTYGEIEFFAFATILEKAKPQFGEKLVDVGSGSGRALVAAALLHGNRLASIEGIELLEDLHDLSVASVEQYFEDVEEERRAYVGSLPQHYPKVEVHLGDLRSVDWSDADIVFANSTCFSAALMTELGAAATRLKPGSRVITLTRALDESEHFEVISRQRYTMSWGGATAFMHVRL